MIETLNVMERGYIRARLYGKKDDHGNLWHSHERLQRIERRRHYVVRHRITITMYDMAKSTDVGARRSPGASLPSGLVKILELVSI